MSLLQTQILFSSLAVFSVGIGIGYMWRTIHEIKDKDKIKRIISTYRKHMHRLWVYDEETLREVIKGKTFDEIELLNQRLKRIK